MLMNRTETWVVDNPARRALRRWYEAPTPAPTRRSAARGVPCRGHRLRVGARHQAHLGLLWGPATSTRSTWTHIHLDGSVLRCMGPPVARVLPPRGRIALSHRPDAVAELPTVRVPIYPSGSGKQLPEYPSPSSRFNVEE